MGGMNGPDETEYWLEKTSYGVGKTLGASPVAFIALFGLFVVAGVITIIL